MLWLQRHMASKTYPPDTTPADAKTLRELRAGRSLTQSELARSLKLTQPDVSRLERRQDILISTLRRFVEATGGQLDLVARYPSSDAVRIELDTRQDA